MKITNIQRFCVNDGPGIRTTVFFKGCPLSCQWCHNPETQSCKQQLLFYENMCIGCGACNICQKDKCTACGECAKNCPTGARELVGKDYSPSQLYQEIQKDILFYAENGGVTFSGGECMLQSDALKEVLIKCKQNNIHTAIDTSGCVSFENFENVLPYTDLFLYDRRNEKYKKSFR